MGRPTGSYLDPHRDEIEAALETGASVSAVARALSVPRATLAAAMEAWARPERREPGQEELEALRKLAESL